MYYYVYRISNLVENKHYYGKRSSKIEPKLDLGIKYFSSSTDKEFISSQIANPENYEYTVVAYCDTAKEALDLEIYLHEYYNVGVSPRFYNKAKQTATSFSTDGIHLTEERKKRLSEVNTGKKLSEEVKRKVGLAGIGRKQTAHCKAVLRSVHVGSKRSEETRIKMSLAKSPLINVYNYITNEIIAEKVAAGIWCKENNYNAYLLKLTLKRDLNKPHYGGTKSKYEHNLHHYRHMYATLAD
jgi:hypothetical protein